MSDEFIEIPKVPIRPIDCLGDAKRLIGEQYWLFVGICAVGLILGTIVPLNILLGPFMCGIYLCMFQRFRNERVIFDTLFKGFDYFLESLIATLVLTGVSVFLFGPVYLFMFFGMMGISSSQDRLPSLGILFVVMALLLLLGVLSIIIGVLFCFTYPLIVDRGMKAIPALTTSVRAGIANFGGLLCLMLLVMGISIAAAVFCYVPVFLVSPITLGAILIAYRRVFPDKMNAAESPGENS